MEQILNPLHLACIADEFRYNLRLIEIKNNIATATNGTILVKVDLTKTSNLLPEQLKIFEGKYIDMEVWKEIYKCDSLEVDDEFIRCNKDGITKIFEYSLPQGEFFKTDSIVLDLKESGESPVLTVGFTPKSLTIVSKIFQSDTLVMNFNGIDKGVFAHGGVDSGMFAVIMPQRIENTNRYFFI